MTIWDILVAWKTPPTHLLHFDSIYKPWVNDSPTPTTGSLAPNRLHGR